MFLSPYQKKIYRAQDAILQSLNKKKDFSYVLSGGTALSRFYFHHRFSEDLDFFCEDPDYSFEIVEGIINHLRRSGFTCELVGRTDKAGHLKVTSYLVGPCPIKVDFLEDPFTGMWEPVRKKTGSGLAFRVDALDQIYYRKFFSLVEQWHRSRKIVRTKDLVDLYCLHCYHRPIEKTLKFFRRHHVPVDEEKIILIFSGLKEKDVEKEVQNLSCPLKGGEISRALKKSANNVFREGIKK